MYCVDDIRRKLKGRLLSENPVFGRRGQWQVCRSQHLLHAVHESAAFGTVSSDLIAMNGTVMWLRNWLLWLRKEIGCNFLPCYRSRSLDYRTYLDKVGVFHEVPSKAKSTSVRDSIYRPCKTLKILFFFFFVAAVPNLCPRFGEVSPAFLPEDQPSPGTETLFTRVSVSLSLKYHIITLSLYQRDVLRTRKFW